jgi:hypothetical protein
MRGFSPPCEAIHSQRECVMAMQRLLGAVYLDSRPFVVAARGRFCQCNTLTCMPLPDGEGLKLNRPVLDLSTQDIFYPNIVFGRTFFQVILPRFQSSSSMTIPLTLWTNSAFFTESSESLILHWLLFGGLVTLLIYHIFLLFSLKEITYLYFVILIVGIVAMLLEYLGYFSLYFIPNLYQYKTLYILCLSV